MKKFTLLLAVLLLLSISSAQAQETGFPCMEINCNVDFAYEGDETLTLFNLPNGEGSPFSEAHLPDGSIVDATLRVQILDCNLETVVDFPFEDIWLNSVDDGMVPCIGGTTADEDTDEAGWTIWASPLHAGGFSTSGCQLFINGMTPLGWEDLPLNFNSADISGDGLVTLVDVVFFAGSYFGDYTFAADLSFDGVLNLPDVVLLAGALGAACP